MIAVILASFLALAFVLSLVAIPIAGRWGRRVGLVDVPDERRKLHVNSIPLIGGIVVFSVTVGICLAGFCFLAMGGEWHSLEYSTQLAKDYGGLFLASAVLLIVGIADDRFGIRGRQKLLGQIVACTILIIAGYRFEFSQILGVQLGDLSVIISVILVYLWLLGAINSINLLDGADGFASTIGIIIGLALCAIAAMTNHLAEAVLLASLTGALAGFLVFNFPPAKVFLGDAGSMLIGFVFAACAIRCSFKEATTLAFCAPVALLAIPMFDTLAAILRRRLTGRSIYAVDRAHLHHTLERRGFSPVVSLAVVAVLCAITAAGACLSVMFKTPVIAIVCALFVVVALVSTRIFGFAEFQLVSTKIATVGKSFFDVGRKANRKDHHSALQLQGERDWQLIWQRLVQFAKEHDFRIMRLDLHLPWIHESFHATYKKKTSMVEEGQNWTSGLPLYVERKVVGRIDIEASENREISPYETMNDLVSLLASLEPWFIEIMHSMDSGMPVVEPVEGDELATPVDDDTVNDSIAIGLEPQKI